MNDRPIAVFFVLGLGIYALATLGVPVDALCTGDTLSVIQRPLLNIPAIVTVGDTLTIECEAGPGTSGWAADLVKDDLLVSLPVLTSAYDPSTLWWTIDVEVPAVSVYELYDLVVTANGGIEDVTWNAVSVIPEFKDDYYFIQVTDPHLVTTLYYYESGADTDTSSIVDLREVINDINIINPEFVLLTGDLVNEGELEEFLNKQYYTRAQALLTEFAVPVYLTSGNHDLGGWDETPPPDGNARRNWWRFFGWKRLDDPPPGAPAYTQDYSFDYGPVHYIGLEAYINYDGWRSNIYGSQSFTSAQMQWLEDDIAAHSASDAIVLFYHYDFSNQINLNTLGVDMALWGHTHRNEDDTRYPYDVGTNNTCNGERSYRLVRVSSGSVEPTSTLSAGSNGNNLRVDYSPANDGTHDSVTADITNNLGQRFEHGLIRFIMPNQAGTFDVSGGSLLQTDTSGPYTICYVEVDIQASSSQSVTIDLDTSDTEDPLVAVTSPNGGETWDKDTTYAITWTASDNIGVTSITVLLSRDGGISFPDTIAAGEPNDGTYDWYVEADTTTQARIRVVAYDAVGNIGWDDGNSDFEITDPSSGPGTDPEALSEPVIASALPNPFSRRTVVRFGIPQPGNVDLALYDVNGRLAARLATGYYTSGYHEVAWDNDGIASAGVYFLKLGFGTYEITRKVVVAR